MSLFGLLNHLGEEIHVMPLTSRLITFGSGLALMALSACGGGDNSGAPATADVNLAGSLQGSWLITTTITGSDCEPVGTVTLGRLSIASAFGESAVQITDDLATYAGSVKDARLVATRVGADGSSLSFDVGLIGPGAMDGSGTLLSGGCRTEFLITGVADTGLGSLDLAIANGIPGSYRFAGAVEAGSGITALKDGSSLDADFIILVSEAPVVSIRLIGGMFRGSELTGIVTQGRVEASGQSGDMSLSFAAQLTETFDLLAAISVQDLSGATANASDVVEKREVCVEAEGDWALDFGTGPVQGFLTQTFCAGEWEGGGNAMVGFVEADGVWAGVGSGALGDFTFQVTIVGDALSGSWSGGALTGARTPPPPPRACPELVAGEWDLVLTDASSGTALLPLPGVIVTQSPNGCDVTMEAGQTLTMTGTVDTNGNWQPSLTGNFAAALSAVVITFSVDPSSSFTGTALFAGRPAEITGSLR